MNFRTWFGKYLLFLALLPCFIVSEAQVDTTFHIYLMFGQSNMEGAGTIETQDRVTNSRVWMLQDSTCPNLNRKYGTWYLAAPPLNRCWGGLGPGDSFGRILGEKAPAYVTKIGLVNASVSGCNIFIYKKGCPDGLDAASQGIPFNCGYTWLLDLAKKAQQAGVIKGIIFHQGETNNTDQNWKYTVKQIVEDLKADLGLDDIPFLAGELLYSQYGSCCSAHNIEINKLPGIIPNAHVISASGLPGKDYAHFTNPSYRALGQRYAEKMLKLVYNICDSTTIESWYSLNGGAQQKSQNIVASTNTPLVLSPQPAYGLGTWNWSGAGTTGTSRQQTLSFDTTGVYTALVTYKNECNITSHMTVKITVCNAAPTESWFKNGNNNWQEGDVIHVETGSELQIEARTDDTTGTWSWTGAGTTGSQAIQTINTQAAGIFTATATYTNSCGAKAKMPFEITVCDSTRIEPKYQLNGGWPQVSDSIRVVQNDALTLLPFPSSGIWNWSGMITGTGRTQVVNTSLPGNYIATATYTNSCGIQSMMNIRIYIGVLTAADHVEKTQGEVLLFPNPALNAITIKSMSGSLGDIKLAVVINMAGQKVMEFHPKNAGSEFTIDISSLSEGTYYLQLSTEDNTVVKKFGVRPN